MPKEIKKYSNALIKLFKYKFIENKDPDWPLLKTYQNEIKEYLYIIGQDMILSENDGIAFRKQLDLEEYNIIRLANKQKIHFYSSAVLMYLAEKYYQEETNVTKTIDGVFVSMDEIKDDVGLKVFSETNNTEINKKIVDAVKRIAKYGYLEEVGNNETDMRYRIIPIVKYKITTDAIEDFNKQLKEKSHDTEK